MSTPQVMNGPDDDSLDPLESRLAELRLREPANLPEQMYQAGWAAAMSEVSRVGPRAGVGRWAWPATACVGALTSAILLVLLLQLRSDARAAPIVEAPDGPPAAGLAPHLPEPPPTRIDDDLATSDEPLQLERWIEQKLQQRLLPEASMAEPATARSRSTRGISVWELSRPVRNTYPGSSLRRLLPGDA